MEGADLKVEQRPNAGGITVYANLASVKVFTPKYLFYNSVGLFPRYKNSYMSDKNDGRCTSSSGL